MPPTIHQAISETYAKVPYHSDAFSQSCPENLETVAHLFGYQSPPSATARVLELGCASGGNLIPFAARYPTSYCVGIDLVENHIRQGQAIVDLAGLTNIQLFAMNIEDLPSTLGTFDYIICHGVYSWVPPSVQQAILNVCQRHLAIDGVAYISYNTYPGWKTKEILRDAMLLRAKNSTDPTQQIGLAKGMVEFLHQKAQPGSVLQAVMDAAVNAVLTADDHYLMHEYLELCNSPCYLHQFITQADQHGLRYLAEAQPQVMFAQNLGQETAQALLAELSHSQTELEQFMDFVVNRAFRQTLLVHQDAPQKPQYGLQPQRYEALHFAGFYHPPTAPTEGLQPLAQPDQLICGCNGVSFQVQNELQRIVLTHLTDNYPATVNVQTLIEQVMQSAAAPHDRDIRTQILSLLEYLVVSGGVRYRKHAVKVAKQLEDHPRTLPLEGQKARHLATGAIKVSVTNVWHEAQALDSLEQALMPVLDGQHDHAALALHLVEQVNAGRLRFQQDQQWVQDPQPVAQLAQAAVMPTLVSLRKKGLLVGD